MVVSSAFNGPSNLILQKIIHHTKYGKYKKEAKRRENYEESVGRNERMHLDKFSSDLHPLIIEAYKGVYDREYLPSMRSLQFGGPAIFKNPARLYNCSACAIDHPKAFSEVFFLLLSGCGVGYSVQKHHVSKLPEIRTPGPEIRFLAVDTIEGWADCIDALVRAYFYGDPLPRFDFSDIRKAKELLKTSGGRAPGHEPLKKCLEDVHEIFKRKTPGHLIQTIECHDILCLMANAVLSGGVRRSSYVCLFSHDDQDMLTCKTGNWYEHSPWRARANNDACLLRGKHDEKFFWDYWELIANSGSGEPGLFWTNSLEWLFNPCLEASLRPGTFCNLATLNAATIYTQEELNHRARMASRIASLQSSFTDFHYLRPFWKHRTEEDALIGVSMTGIMAGNVLNLDLEEAAHVVMDENAQMAAKTGINVAKRSTLLKPEGTSSLALGGLPCGIHGGLADGKHLRRITLNKNEAIYSHLMRTVPDLLEASSYNDAEAYLLIPMEMPSHVKSQDEEGSLAVLERIKHFHEKWVTPGHREGENKNNVSSTVYVRDWDRVGKWMWENREHYTAISVLPPDDNVYPQMMYESIPDKRHAELTDHLLKVDLSDVREEEDNTSLVEAQACAGGQCLID